LQKGLRHCASRLAHAIARSANSLKLRSTPRGKISYNGRMKIRPVVRGLLSSAPGGERLLPRRGTGGTGSALYCYEVWLKHLTMLHANGLRAVPRTLAELGPGDSIGIGLAAMLSGVDHYCALDVVKYSSAARNSRILDELISLFRTRAGRPSDSWPNYDAYLDERLFPSAILTEEKLAASLSEERISLIRAALQTPGSARKDVSIQYMVPWTDARVIEPHSIDTILSHAVLEHVVDLEGTYRALSLWLRPGGMMSHQIDFTSHGVSDRWNGYRAYPEWLWRIIAGKRAYLLNRQPCSVHIELARKSGFKIICLLRKSRTDGIARSQLSPRWRDISDDDLACSDFFYQALKL